MLWGAEHVQGREEALRMACCSLLSPTECHCSCRKFTTDIGYGKNNEYLQRLRGGLGHCMVSKTVFTLLPPPPQNGTHFKIAVVLLSCKNLTFNRLVKLCTKRQNEAQEKEVLSDPWWSKAQRDFTGLFWRFICLEFYWLSCSEMAKTPLCYCTNFL